MKLNDIAALLGQTIVVPQNVRIQWLLTDSRALTFPDESLFFALKSQRNDGHNYVAELYRQNLRYFVVSEMREEFREFTDAVFLQVSDTLDALQSLATSRRSGFSLPVVGITGSNGKTVVKEWLYQLLHTDYRIVRSPRSFNSQTGVPLSVWALNADAQLGIFEAGISQTHEMQKLQRIIQPTIGIFTNLGEAHQENFYDKKQKCVEKLGLFIQSEVLIYCSDHELVHQTIGDADLKAQLFAWGSTPDAQLLIVDKQQSAKETRIELIHNQQSLFIHIPFTDAASVENSMHCVALLVYFGYAEQEINRRLQQLEAVAMRLEVKEGEHSCLIINDSYNSDLNSLTIALDFLQQQATANNLTRTLILSDILQSGIPSESLYRSVNELLVEKKIHRFIGVGKQISGCADVFSLHNQLFYETTDEFLKSPLIHTFKNEVILLKGSRAFRFENISEKLELIAHETTLEVNLNALVDNLNYFRSQLRPSTKVMCMVKAFAYGSGAVEVARTLQHHRCDFLAVAVADEGAELRREGIRIPIVVMNPEKGGFGTIFDHNLEPEIYSFRLLDLFIQAAEKLGLTNYPIHLKIDSGMHRLGFEPDDMDQLIQRLGNQTQVKVRSVFSHLAGADDVRFDEFTAHQVDIFTRCADSISAAFPHHILRHILNSAGTQRFPQFQFDMVRLGIGHYGISALPGIQLKQVCALKTIILQIKHIEAGETVGYNRKGVVATNKTIAILPIGYADGFDRKLGNGVGEVLVNGRKAPVIGNVSMDLTAIDITGIPAEEGDSVEIFGENLLISDMATRLQTIPYEVLTSVSRRVKRVYFLE